MNHSPLPERASARLLILDRERQAILLLRVNDPHLSQRFADGRSCWVTTGGGVEAGETFEETAVRELWEETGLVAGRDARIHGVVRDCRRTIPWGPLTATTHITSVERYFAVSLLTDPSTVCDTNLVEAERTFICAYQWWTEADIRRATDAGTDAFFPEEIADYFADVSAAASAAFGS